MLYLEIIVFVIVLLCVLSFLSLAPWVPTKKHDLKRIHRLIWLKKHQKFLEIWCGNGRVSLYLAKHNPNAEIIWIELSPLFYIISLFRAKVSWLQNIKILYWNALKLDISSYDILYVFWLPETVSNKIFPKLKKEMKKTARFYSYCFQMTNDYFEEIKHKPNDITYAIYEYEKS